MSHRCWLLGLFAAGFLVCLGRIAGAADATATIEFNRDIRPILAENCYFCHGPDKNKRQADLRLDTHDGLLSEASVGPVVTPGKPDESELWRRVSAESDDERMPPADSGKSLDAEQIALLKSWIEQGAPWEGHWAFNPIRRPQPPAVGETPAANAIDAFIEQGLAARGGRLSPPAEPRTLARRLSFDLTGLPPTIDDVEAFVADPSPAAYEQLVDRLLASPRYGERMAVWWLDLVRYADTVGYHGDQPVSIYPFRTWVIEAFNANKRFDEFTVEQLAGDLLPEPTVAQRIASGYNRLGMMSAEGGVQDKEYRAKYAAERVRNASLTWMGATLGCAECHDHKFDPFLAKDFYQFEAFFADIDERGFYGGANVTGEWGPRIQLPSPEQSQAVVELDAQIAESQGKVTALTAVLAGGALSPGSPSGSFVLPAMSQFGQELKERKRKRVELDRQIPTTLVTVAVEPRPIKILKRGNWMDESGEVVVPGVPAFLPQPAAGDRRLTRLDLAHWLTGPENPLTARVFVNRVWKLLYGAGLSRKIDDLGAQGEWPTHPELLDWLAGQFIDSGWDVKRLVKQIVMSDAYRQSSATSPELREMDPDNRLWGRQGRYRLDAEFVRDNALAVSGLLVEEVGGPSVKPYQPPGYWAHLNFPPREWDNGHGADLYRRGLYTHWQRQYLHPSMLAFDAPSREECAADRPRSNTPLQSLVLLNDPSYVEAARAFAELVLRRPESDPVAKLDWAFRRAVSRPIAPGEADVLLALIEKHAAQYAADPKAAEELLKVGEHPLPDDLPREQLAAWTSACRAILNLHEMVTRN